jgi:hypothetical protein
MQLSKFNTLLQKKQIRVQENNSLQEQWNEGPAVDDSE